MNQELVGDILALLHDIQNARKVSIGGTMHYAPQLRRERVNKLEMAVRLYQSFRAMAQAIEEWEERETVFDNWHSVSDIMPPDGDEAWVYDTVVGVILGVHSRFGWDYACPDYEGLEFYLDNVTHWAPTNRPDPPS